MDRKPVPAGAEYLDGRNLKATCLVVHVTLALVQMSAGCSDQ